MIVFVVCGGFTLGGLAAVCLEKDVSMLVNARVTEAKFFETADVIDDAVEEMEFEIA